MKKEDWIPCSEKYPDTERLIYESSMSNVYTSEPVLVQTKDDDLLIAVYEKTIYDNKSYKDEYRWFSCGIGNILVEVIA